MLQTVYDNIDNSASRLKLSAQELAQIKKINNEHLFDINLTNGKSFKAYRIQHNNDLGPYKGGIRYHKDVNLDEVRSLAILMSLKSAAVGLPLGGGKGGVVLNPDLVTEAELEEISRKYTSELFNHIGPDKDIPAPDINTNSKIIDWMVEEYENISGQSNKASFTGKSIGNSGSLGRDSATGRGGVLSLTKLLELSKNKKSNITYAIQGFGNVGSYFSSTAHILHPSWQLISASDSEAAIYNKNGLDPIQIQSYKKSKKRFSDYKQPGTDHLSNDQMLHLDVDVLVLAGFEDTVNIKNVKAIKASYIVELANGPITGKAYSYLISNKKTILPDILANSGGVIVSYLEWVQNKSDQVWTVNKVNTKLEKYMNDATTVIYKYAVAHNLPLKEAAFDIAIKKLSDLKRIS